MNNLYYIRNVGCDDETVGLARISDEDFHKFKEIIENLNKNSTYGCMPIISVYKTNESNIKEVIVDPNKSFCDEDYVSPENLLYLDGKTYALVKKYWADDNGMEKVI